jgi:hypothetical protein
MVDDTGADRTATYKMGIVETGRSRLFAGYFFTVALGNEQSTTGEDERSMIAALWRLARNLAARGLQLRCVGMSGEFRESGLSENTGWGYFGRYQQPVHMMDEMPSGADEAALDCLIREAVGGMRIVINRSV